MTAPHLTNLTCARRDSAGRRTKSSREPGLTGASPMPRIGGSSWRLYGGGGTDRMGARGHASPCRAGTGGFLGASEASDSYARPSNRSGRSHRVIPAHAAIPRSVVQRRGSPAQQGHQLPLQMRHAPQRLAHQHGVAQVMKSFHVRTPGQQLIGANRSHQKRRARAAPRGRLRNGRGIRGTQKGSGRLDHLAAGAPLHSSRFRQTDDTRLLEPDQQLPRAADRPRSVRTAPPKRPTDLTRELLPAPVSTQRSAAPFCRGP